MLQGLGLRLGLEILEALDHAVQAEVGEQVEGWPAALGRGSLMIGIGGGLAAPPLPHHRAYGSVHGGSSDQAAFGTNGGRPSAASVLLDRAMFRAGLAAIRQGPCALDAVCAASRRGTPLLDS